MKTHVSVNHVL